MARHVVVDGSNLATEGRAMPSLKQLVDAVQAYMDDNPDDLVTVVVDATFGHRIDPKEVAEFDAAIEHNELVAPPAGAVGRGDAFVLKIADKVGAIIISNDSYQEFHGEYDWLFDEGRLVGGKPVPHVGWVFVPRVPVRGPISRRAQRDAKRKDTTTKATRAPKASKAAQQPMPVPKAPPPAAKREPAHAAAGASTSSTAASAPSTAPAPVAATAAAAGGGRDSGGRSSANDLMPFLSFVEKHPVGSSVNAVVTSYASHGANVHVGDIKGYVPLRLMADPPPRSAREAMKVGDAVTLVVAGYHAQRRGIDLGVPGVAGEPEPVPAATPRRRRRAAPDEVAAAVDAGATPAAAPDAGVDTVAAAPTGGQPAARRPAKKAAAKKAAAPTKKAAAKKAAAPTKKAAKKSGAPTKKATKKSAAPSPAPAETSVSTPAEATPTSDVGHVDAPRAKKAPARKAAASATAKKTAAKKAAEPAKKAAKKTPAKRAASGTVPPDGGAAEMAPNG
jgi:hypothetical protein